MLRSTANLIKLQFDVEVCLEVETPPTSPSSVYSNYFFWYSNYCLILLYSYNNQTLTIINIALMVVPKLHLFRLNVDSHLKDNFV